MTINLMDVVEVCFGFLQVTEKIEENLVGNISVYYSYRYISKILKLSLLSEKHSGYGSVINRGVH